jgi:hypothetical protein
MMNIDFRIEDAIEEEEKGTIKNEDGKMEVEIRKNIGSIAHNRRKGIWTSR